MVGNIGECILHLDEGVHEFRLVEDLVERGQHGLRQQAARHGRYAGPTARWLPVRAIETGLLHIPMTPHLATHARITLSDMLPKTAVFRHSHYRYFWEKCYGNPFWPARVCRKYRPSSIPPDVTCYRQNMP
jgi:hypothetical protein